MVSFKSSKSDLQKLKNISGVSRSSGQPFHNPTPQFSEKLQGVVDGKDDFTLCMLKLEETVTKR